MKPSNSRADPRIFVKVSGFTDAERHALNTVFRLSEGRSTVYALWTALAPEPAAVALIDGDSWEATLELANPANDSLQLIWVDDNPPPRAALVLRRPLQWSAVLEGLDRLLAPARLPPAPAAVTADNAAPARVLGVDEDVKAFAAPPVDAGMAPPLLTEYAVESSPEAAAVPADPQVESTHLAVLVVDADPGARLQLRIKLASAGLLQVDEASSAAEALQRVSTRLYAVVFLDLELPDTDNWTLVHQVAASRPLVEVLVLTGRQLSRMDHVRGWFAGARGCLDKPLEPEKLAVFLRMAQ